jgi:Family of unknown function (DUF6519)
MYGDFARVTFDALKQRTRVLMQQGRVQLESDWNEQVAIFLHLLRTLTTDLIGPAGGPEGNCGFAIMTREWLRDSPHAADKRHLAERLKHASDFMIGSGHYYVDGIFCENREDAPYTHQPYCQVDARDRIEMTSGARYLAYLDVVEESVFSVQDESMLEIALGVETAIRARPSWVVRTIPVAMAKNGHTCEETDPPWADLVGEWQSPNRGWLRFRLASDNTSTDPCNVPPESRYRGPENQLYRVEIHRGGTFETAKKPKGKAKGGEAAERGEPPTFKFSRVNGSAVFKIEEYAGSIARLKDLGRDDRFGLREGNWVEVLDDSVAGTAGPMRKVVAVDLYKREVTLDQAANDRVGTDPSQHPHLRRWDHRAGDPKDRGLRLDDGAALITLGEWYLLEDGIEVQFLPPPEGSSPVVFRTGDYWLGPARVATGGVIDWPSADGELVAQAPHGVDHHFAPLAILEIANGDLTVFSQCRRQFKVPSTVVTR